MQDISDDHQYVEDAMDSVLADPVVSYGERTGVLLRVLVDGVRPLTTRTRQIVTALIPAHNEAASIASTITALTAQSRQIDRVIVVADNCTDDTAQISRSTGVDVFTTRDNRHMKAGGLNQALSLFLPTMRDEDLIVIIDADTTVSPNFVEAAIRAFKNDPSIGGVSGVYAGKSGGGLVGWCQRNEYARWGFDSRQQTGKATCLSGAASVFTVAALRRVDTARRAGYIPGPPGVYSITNFTEDFELSQALLHTGSRIRNMLDVTITTAIKPTWNELHIQRRRWNRGITETLMAFGLTRHTASMWIRWLVYTFSILTIPLSLFLVSDRVAAGTGWHMNAWMALWIGVTAVIGVHKSITIIRARGWSALPALFIVTELPYDTFLHLTFVRSLWDVITGTTKKWR